MRTLQLMVFVSALLLVSGCSTKEPRPGQQSILEVVDSANKAGVPQGCGVGEVDYCVTGPGGTKQCTCMDTQEMYRATEGLFAP